MLSAVLPLPQTGNYPESRNLITGPLNFWIFVKCNFSNYMNWQGKSVRESYYQSVFFPGSRKAWEWKRCKKEKAENKAERKHENAMQKYFTHQPSILEYILKCIICLHAPSLPRPGTHHMEPSRPLRPCAKLLSGHQTELRATGTANLRWHELMRTGMGYCWVGVCGGKEKSNNNTFPSSPDQSKSTHLSVCYVQLPLNRGEKWGSSYLTRVIKISKYSSQSASCWTNLLIKDETWRYSWCFHYCHCNLEQLEVKGWRLCPAIKHQSSLSL